MNRPLPLPVALGNILLALSLSACAASPPQGEPPSTASDPADTQAGTCDASILAWTVGQLADEALIERARKEAGALTVRVLRPGMMITNDFSAARLNIRVDTDRKVIAYNCG